MLWCHQRNADLSADTVTAPLSLHSFTINIFAVMSHHEEQTTNAALSLSLRLQSYLYTSHSRLRFVSRPERSLQTPAGISPVCSPLSRPVGHKHTLVYRIHHSSFITNYLRFLSDSQLDFLNSILSQLHRIPKFTNISNIQKALINKSKKFFFFILICKKTTYYSCLFRLNKLLTFINLLLSFSYHSPLKISSYH